LEWEAFLNYELGDVLVLLILQNIFIFLIASLNHRILSKLHTRVSYLDNLFLQYVNNLLNKLITKWGATYRAIFLKSNFSLPYSKFLSVISGYYVINVVTQAVFGLICFQLIYVQTGFYNPVLIIIYALLLLLSFGILITRPSIEQGENFFSKFFSSIFVGWNAILEDPINLLIYFIFSFSTLLVRTWQMFIIFKGMNLDVDIVGIVFLSTLSVILMFINITPDGLGVREWLYLISSELIGVSGPHIVLGSLILRTVSFTVAIIFGGISHVLLQNRKTKIIMEI
jgi:uncharacterized membrane protein YbhN (UPF0104 family)